MKREGNRPMSAKNDFNFNGNIVTHIPTGKVLRIPVDAMEFVLGHMAVDMNGHGVTSAQVFEYACQYVKTWAKRNRYPILKAMIES